MVLGRSVRVPEKQEKVVNRNPEDTEDTPKIRLWKLGQPFSKIRGGVPILGPVIGHWWSNRLTRTTAPGIVDSVDASRGGPDPSTVAGGLLLWRGVRACWCSHGVVPG